MGRDVAWGRTRWRTGERSRVVEVSPSCFHSIVTRLSFGLKVSITSRQMVQNSFFTEGGDGDDDDDSGTLDVEEERVSACASRGTVAESSGYC